MSEVYTYNATHLTTVREGSVSITQSADHGEVGTGSVALDDTAGTQVIVGQKDFSITQSACAFPLSFRGFVVDRGYGRDAGHERKPHVGASRGIRISLEDTNAMLGYLGITEVDGKRPAETCAQRGAWLMASDYVDFADNGRCSFPGTLMDKADYRNQQAGDVLADLGLAADGYNWHVNDWGAGPELTFRNDNTSTADASTMRISNVLADATAVTVHPFKDAELTRRPGRVKSKLAYTYAKGTVTEERPATATAFNGERFGVLSNSNVKKSATASRNARAELWQLHTEEDVIECTVLLTDVQVNLIRHGMRIQAKFSHLAPEGYNSFTWFRILSRTWNPIVADGGLYEVRLKLSPQEEGNSAICLYDDTPTASYYPLGGSGDGDISNPSDGVVYYLRGGLSFPDFPTPGLVGRWHFPTYGSGGSGTIDYFASGFGNELRFIVVGNGTFTIQTEQWLGENQPYTISVRRMVNGNAEVVDFVTGVAGDATAVVITTADAPDCVHDIVLRADARLDGSYIGMGWSQATWA